MDDIEAINIYKKIKSNPEPYNEEIHCPIVLTTISENGRVTSFCKKAKISERTFYRWVGQYPMFRECYEVAKVFAKEDWEAEPTEDWGGAEWRAWTAKGGRLFGMNKEKIRVLIEPGSNPWEQYQKIMADCASGEFTASELKQIMESINVGRVAFESFKLQEEIDKMKKDLNQMSQKNGNNIIPIGIVEK